MKLEASDLDHVKVQRLVKYSQISKTLVHLWSSSEGLGMGDPTVNWHHRKNTQGVSLGEKAWFGRSDWSVKWSEWCQNTFYHVMLNKASLLLLPFLVFFQGCTCGTWKLPGRGRIGAATASLHHSTAMQEQSCFFDLHPSSWQRWILNAMKEARVNPTSSWMLVRFGTAEPQWELKLHYYHCCYIFVNMVLSAYGN